VGLKTAIKRILFQPGEQKREVIGGALRGLSFTFDLHVDTQRWRGQYERPLQHWLQKHVRIGSVCLDVGAADGYFALLMAKLAGPPGRVYAFEPGPQCPLIAQHFEWNKSQALATLEVYQKLVVAADDPADEKSVSIDRIVRDGSIARVNVAKIDVEGAELDVLRGMAQTLERDHPHLFIEVHSKELEREVLQLTKRCGYTLKKEAPPASADRPLPYNTFVYSQT